MYLHPDDHLATFHATAREKHQQAAQERLVRHVQRANRTDRRARWAARLADNLTHYAPRVRARAV